MSNEYREDLSQYLENGLGELLEKLPWMFDTSFSTNSKEVVKAIVYCRKNPLDYLAEDRVGQLIFITRDVADNDTVSLDLPGLFECKVLTQDLKDTLNRIVDKVVDKYKREILDNYFEAINHTVHELKDTDYED